MSVPAPSPAAVAAGPADKQVPAADPASAAAAAAIDPLLALVARIAARDEAALAEFYERCVSIVFGLVLRITRIRAVAEEVVADVFLQAWQQAGRFDAARGRPLAWLLTIARSRALDALRRADPAEAVEDVAALLDIQTQDPAAVDGAPRDPLSVLDDDRRDAAIARAVASLSPVQRQVIALAYFRGLSQTEIAGHLGMPLGTVKSHSRIALQALRQALLADPADR